MASKRSQITMTDDEVQAYLETERVLNVATIGPTGHPHLVAMWFAMIDGKPVFWTFGKSQKIVNLRRDSKMTGLVESGDGRTTNCAVSSCVGGGRSSTTTRQSWRSARRSGVKYSGRRRLDEAALPFLEAQATKRVGVVFEVDHIASWDHTKLAGSY